MKKYLLIFIGMALILSEIMLRIKPEFAFISYSVLIGGCLIALSKKKNLDNHSKLLIVFLILPIVRISELFLNFSLIWNTAVLSAIFFFLVIFYSVKFKINPGYKSKFLILIPVVILLGANLGLMGNALFEFEKVSGFLFFLPILIFSEEVLFRGMIQNLVKQEYSVFSSIFFTSLIYGIFSLSFGLLEGVFFFFISMILSLIYNYTKNIYLSILLSFAFHLVIFVL